MAGTSIIHTNTITLPDGTIVGSPETIASGALHVISEDIPSNQTDLPVALAFANAKIKGFFIHATVNMTVYTNDTHSGSPQEKFNLLAGQLYEWSLTGSYIGSGANASTLGGNVTALYVTNTTAGKLTVVVPYDPT